MNLHIRIALILSFVLLAACVVPRPTPTVSPPPTGTPVISPLMPPTVTPLPKPPTVVPVPPTVTPNPPYIITDTLKNPDFERPYRAVGSAMTLPNSWSVGYVNPSCDPDTPGCYVTCPVNCINPATGRCRNDTGCYWMQPEWAEAWYADYAGLRVHTGQSAVKSFTFGRMGEWWEYQRVGIVPGDVMTFSVYLSTWMCYNYDNCSKGQRSDKPTAMHLRVGIDPAGGTIVTSTNILWSAEGDAFRIRKDDMNYWHKFVVTATAQGGYATVFVYARVDWSQPATDFPELYDGNYPRTNNDLYVDTANLEIERTASVVYLPVVRK